MIGFRELLLWSVGCFISVGWHWPAAIIRPLASALLRKQVSITATADSDEAPQLVTIHFDGSVEPRESGSVEEFKGKLYLAEVGDVIYSKIDVRNGAIGLIPADMPRCAVSSEYPVYQVRSDVALGEYIKLVFRTNHFRQVINGMISGASGRKRVQPERIEFVDIPLPSLETQRAIVARWQAAQAAADAAVERITQLETEIEIQFLIDLGLKAPNSPKSLKAFAVPWREFVRWTVSHNQATQSGADLTQGKHPVIQLGSVLEMVQYGTSQKANSIGSGTPVIRMNNIKDGSLDLSNLKHVELSPHERNRLLLQDGDILFNRTNSKELVGKCAVFHKREEYVFASYLIRVRTEPSRATPDFLVQVINSPIGRQQIDALSRQIIGQANINSEELRSFHIPLPPIDVQRAIVERVQVARAEIARLRAEAARIRRAARAEVEAMILGVAHVDGAKLDTI